MAEVLLITALVLTLFFIFFVRPARAVQKRRRRDLNDLRIGDEVLTTGGLIATVVAVETPPTGPMVLHLEIDEDVVVRARTSAIEERLQSADERQAAQALDSGFDDDDSLPDLQLDDGIADDVAGDEAAEERAAPPRRASGG